MAGGDEVAEDGWGSRGLDLPSRLPVSEDKSA